MSAPHDPMQDFFRAPPRRRTSRRGLLLGIVVGVLALIAGGVVWMSARATQAFDEWLTAVAPSGSQFQGVRVRPPARVYIAAADIPLDEAPGAPRIVLHDVAGSVEMLSLLRGTPTLALHADYSGGAIALSLTPAAGSPSELRHAGGITVHSEARQIGLEPLALLFGVGGVTGQVNADAEGLLQPSNIPTSRVRSTISAESLSIPEIPMEGAVLPANPGARSDIRMEFVDGVLHVESANVAGPAYNVTAIVDLTLRDPIEASPISGTGQVRLKRMPRLTGGDPDQMALTQAFLSLAIQAKIPIHLRLTGLAGDPIVEFDSDKTLAALASQ